MSLLLMTTQSIVSASTLLTKEAGRHLWIFLRMQLLPSLLLFRWRNPEYKSVPSPDRVLPAEGAAQPVNVHRLLLGTDLTKISKT